MKPSPMFFAAVGCFGLAACTTIPGVQPFGRVATAESSDVAELLERYERLVGQPVEEQRKEFAAAQAAFDQAATEASRLRLALALSLPQAPWRDDARVVSLLAEPNVEPNPGLRRRVAQLLYRLTVERQRLVREEQKRVENGQQADQKRLEAMLHDERRKSDELQQKLEALREIDRNSIKPPRR